MNQEELKQRLIDLIADKVCNRHVKDTCLTKWGDGCGECEHGRNFQIGDVAARLIANGVTIRENEESIANGTIISAKNIKFNTGDYAIIVGNESSHHFALGTIVQLEKHETDYRATDVNGCYWWVIDDELEPADVADWEGVKYDA